MSEIRHTPTVPTVAQRRAAGERISRHRHDEHQLVYVSTGVLAVTTAAGRWVAAADRAVWLPAGTWHEHRFYGASAFHSIGFAVDRAPLPDRAPAVVAVSALLRELLLAITEGALPEPETRRIRAVVRDQLRRTREEPIMLPAARDPRLAAACALATADLSEPVGLGGAGPRDQHGRAHALAPVPERVRDHLPAVAHARARVGGDDPAGRWDVGDRGGPALRLGDDERLRRDLPPHARPHPGRVPAQPPGSLGLTAASETRPLNTRMKPPPRAVASRRVLPS